MYDRHSQIFQKVQDISILPPDDSSAEATVPEPVVDAQVAPPCSLIALEDPEQVRLERIAFLRSGDKGDSANIGKCSRQGRSHKSISCCHAWL